MPDKNILYVNAANIHQGGGAKLLRHLLSLPFDRDVLFLLDSRLFISDIKLDKRVALKLVRPNIKSRFLSELWLSKNATSRDVVLCFGNFPPLFNSSSKIIVFLQNRFLIDSHSLKGFSFKSQLRLGVERLWFKLKSVNADQIVVQTPTMKMLLTKHISHKDIKVISFFPEEITLECKIKMTSVSLNAKSIFLYVASGDPHKNHINLIEAWCILAEEGVFPTLILTIDSNRYAALLESIEFKMKSYQLMIKNISPQEEGRIDSLYKNVDALIYPSLLESFGLPLIEARAFDLPIIASELDYVRDLVDPEESFDPHAPVSIARAVKRFIGIVERPLPLLSATEFLDQILAKTK